MSVKYNFFLIGTGATGSQLLPMLTQLLNNIENTQVTLIDGDIVESKNLKNQKFLERDIGFYKSEILAERYQRVYPKLKIKYVPEYIKSYEQCFNIIDKQTNPYNNIAVLIGCVDNVETRKILCETVEYLEERNFKYIYIDSGNGTINRNGQIIISSNINEFNCQILPWDIYPEIKNSTETIDKVLSCGAQTDKHPQNIATNIYAAANIFMVITNLLMFNKIENNFIKFNADKIDVISRNNTATL